MPAVPFILVGTKTDARVQSHADHVATVEGEHLARDLGAKFFGECSSRENSNVQQVFQNAIRAALAARKQTPAGCKCTLS
jgi:GTPase SAR1 family protein